MNTTSGNSLLYDAVTSRSPWRLKWWSLDAEVLSGDKNGWSLRIFRSWSSLYRRCNDFIRWSAPFGIVVTQCRSSAGRASEDLVSVTLVRKAVGLLKVVSSEGWHEETKFTGVKLVDLCSRASKASLNNCTYMSQSHWSSTPQCLFRAIIINVKHTASQFDYWWCAGAGCSLVPGMVCSYSKNLLLRWDLVSVSTW